MMDDDSLAFEGYMAATRLPKTTEDEKTSRRDAMQEALKSSTTSPLKLAVRICDLVDLLSATFSTAPKSIASDLYVGAAMLEAGFAGAVANVYVNLAYLKDVAFQEETRATIQRCRQRVADLSSFKDSIGRLLAIP
jgi:formiminotetrahydrofolate cyclodeaminase